MFDPEYCTFQFPSTFKSNKYFIIDFHRLTSALDASELTIMGEWKMVKITIFGLFCTHTHTNKTRSQFIFRTFFHIRMSLLLIFLGHKNECVFFFVLCFVLVQRRICYTLMKPLMMMMIDDNYTLISSNWRDEDNNRPYDLQSFRFSIYISDIFLYEKCIFCAFIAQR